MIFFPLSISKICTLLESITVCTREFISKSKFKLDLTVRLCPDPFFSQSYTESPLLCPFPRLCNCTSYNCANRCPYSHAYCKASQRKFHQSAWVNSVNRIIVTIGVFVQALRIAGVAGIRIDAVK